MMRRILVMGGLLVGIFTSGQTARATLLMNEVMFNPPGTDAPNEFVEIFGTTGESLTNVYLVGIEGDNGANPGDVQTIFNLSSFSLGSNGFLVLLQRGNSYTVDPLANTATGTTTGFGGLVGFSADPPVSTDIENASVTFMLIRTTTPPTLSDDIDSDNDGTPDGPVFSGWTILDSVGMTDASSDKAYGAHNFLNFNSSGGYLARTGYGATDWLASVPSGTAPNFQTGSLTSPASQGNKPINTLGTFNTNFGQSAVPEPTVPLLLGMGLLGLFAACRRRR